MYREYKKEDKELLQETGKEKPIKKSKVSLASAEPSPDEKKPSHRSSKRKLSFVNPKTRRPYFQHESRRLSNR